ncbi:serine protease inhibitor dipetalogastin-like [Coccinella septempunctata]|uniref:serine protease inhibitor dipetalogastin-like n=1 Tax=Coccinella septempunctata TaxID=41139 RepID=UPI001D08E58B|nr:serine protease inhibitor dipetalogastin-like [Coccinella septempunctata]
MPTVLICIVTFAVRNEIVMELRLFLFIFHIILAATGSFGSGDYHDLDLANKKSCQCTMRMNYSPVCGSDGKTYGNEDKLYCRQECYDPGLTIAYEGKCRGN